MKFETSYTAAQGWADTVTVAAPCQPSNTTALIAGLLMGLFLAWAMDRLGFLR